MTKPYLTAAAFARIVGVTREAVRQAMNSGRLPFVMVGRRRMLDQVAALLAWETQTDVDQQLRATATAGASRREVVAAKAMRERTLAELLALDLDERRGALVDPIAAKRAFEAKLAIMRAEMSAACTRIVAALDQVSDRASARKIIDAELREAMRRTADEWPPRLH